LHPQKVAYDGTILFMTRYTEESLNQLKSRIDLVEVVGQHIELKKAGASYKALCPFHDEKTPSFVIARGDSHYHCFGCGAHGDAIQFLMEHQKFGFVDAIQSLAERFGVRLEREEEQGTRTLSRARQKEVLEKAGAFYETILLKTEEGKGALDYLLGRGMPLSFITTFRIGFAPRQEGAFLAFMKDEGCTLEELSACGLISLRDGRAREFFQERITFPIHDPQGAIIGFSARKIREEVFGGKYINTSETELFKKSRILFALNWSRKRIIKQKQAIIVEGQIDALRLIYSGFDFTVAGLGTAFGEQHAKDLIALGVEKVFLLLDGDEAGKKAAIKIGQLFLRQGIEVQVADLKPGEDPDLLLLKGGPMAIAKKLLDSKEFLFFLFSYFSKGVNLHSPAEKNKVLQEIILRLREWDNPIMVHESIKRIAHLANVPEELLLGQVRTGPVERREKESKESQAIDPDKILEQDLLRWLLVVQDAALFDIAKAHLASGEFRNPLARRVFEILLASFEAKKGVDLLALLPAGDGEVLDIFLQEVLSRKINREKAQPLLVETIERIKRRNWMLECENLRLKIHSGQLPDAEVLELVKAFDQLKKSPPKIKI
jgi:DNA primase